MSTIVSDYQINNLSSTYELGYHLNLAVLAKQLPINSTISYIKLWGLTEKRNEAAVTTRLDAVTTRLDTATTKLVGVHTAQAAVTTKLTGVHTAQATPITSEYAEIMTHIEKQFTNQCTLTIRPEKAVAMNFKVYGHGKIIMTGCRRRETAIKALQILVEHLQKIPDTPLIYQIETCYLFHNLKKFQSVSGENSSREQSSLSRRDRAFFNRLKRKILIQQPVLEKVAEYCLNIMKENLPVEAAAQVLQTDQIITQLIEALDQVDINQLDSLLWSQPGRINLRWLKVYELLNLYYDQDTILNANFDHLPLINLIRESILNFGSANVIEITVPLTYQASLISVDAINDNQLQAQNYNTSMRANLDLNLEVTQGLLKNQSNFQANYEPTARPAIKASYLTNVDCEQHSQGQHGQQGRQGLRNSQCQCKKVSLLIFRNSKVIINGARSLTQIQATYQALKTFFETYSRAIRYHLNDTKPLEIADHHLPELIKLDPSPNQQFPLLLKKSFILANDQNQLILQQLKRANTQIPNYF